jgi:predicted lipase
MIDAAVLAHLQQDIYSPGGDEFDEILDFDSVYVGKVRLNGSIVLVFRGSVTPTDWLRDFECVPVAVPLIGTVHAGMWAGVSDMFDRLNLQAVDAVSIVGHSLGCAHAAFTARLCLLRGIAVRQLYMLAPPRMGYADFIDGLRNVGDLRAWHNGLDIVTDVPVVTDDMPWAQFPLIEIVETPGGIENLNPIDYHAVELYARGISS